MKTDNDGAKKCGRPRKEERYRTASFTIDKDVYSDLIQLAKLQNKGISAIVTEAVRKYFEPENEEMAGVLRARKKLLSIAAILRDDESQD